ncbi:MAG: hypothetical protein HWD86_00250 [Kangiellaceae bacterium]|nr:hypothetical protein [Kangiellaceae bacterium]
MIRIQPFIFIVLICLILLFSFEEMLYGRLLNGELSYILAKTFSELLVYGILFLVVVAKCLDKSISNFRVTKADFCILFFLMLVFISTLINNGDLFKALINLRAMMRYIAFYYIIVLLQWTPTSRQLDILIKVLSLIVITQVGFTLLQHVLGEEFRDRFFAPPVIKAELTEIQSLVNNLETKIGVGYGSFGRPAALAFFLFICAIIFFVYGSCYKNKSISMYLMYFLCLIGIFYTYKRGPLLLTLSIPIIWWWFVGHRFRVMLLGAIMLSGVIALMMVSNLSSIEYVKAKEVSLSPIQSLMQLLSIEYWQNTSSGSRGWFIMEVGKEAITSFKPLGYGADVNNAQSILAAKGGAFGKLVGWNAFEDVFVIASLIYYGPLGLLVLTLFLILIYRRSIFFLKQTSNNNVLVQSFRIACFLLPLALFMERALELRAFSFIFWTLAGVSIASSIKSYSINEKDIKNTIG